MIASRKRKRWAIAFVAVFFLVALGTIGGMIDFGFPNQMGRYFRLSLGLMSIVAELTDNPRCPPIPCPLASLPPPTEYFVIWGITTTRGKGVVTITPRKLYEHQTR